MSTMIDSLEPDFRRRVDALLNQMKTENIEMRLSAGLRSPTEQARLWRQSRTAGEVRAAVAHLKSGGAHYLAEVLEAVGPCNGPPVTKSLPGLSWHQWGEAADCFWVVNGVAEWSTARVVEGDNGYHALARTAARFGLTAGGTWPVFRDWPHVQLKPEASPLTAGLSLSDVDGEMRRRFG